MHAYQQEFLEFAIQQEVLRFGSFTLKSGRLSPYFFNAGLFNSGQSLSRLGRYYAQSIEHSGIAFDMLFGPAFKGIPLAAAAVIALADHHQRDVPYAFNRKEAKDHGEGGTTVGAPLQGRVMIIDDVVSAGTSVGESVEIIRAQGAEPVGVAIALDRQERGQGTSSAVQEIQHRYGLRVSCIVGLTEMIEYLATQPDRAEVLNSIRIYQTQYGIQQ